MRIIVSTLLRKTIFRVAPVHLPADQIEPAVWGLASAGDLYRVTNVRSNIPISQRTTSGNNAMMNDSESVSLFPMPVIWRNRKGYDVCLNHACVQRYAGVFNPQQLIEVLVLSEEDLTADAARLVQFRFEFIDPALMPSSNRTTRTAWAARLQDEFEQNTGLESLVAYYWLGRQSSKGLSANDKAGLLENAVSANLFYPSYRENKTSAPPVKGSPLDLAPPEVDRAVAVQNVEHFRSEFNRRFEDARPLTDIVRDLDQKHSEAEAQPKKNNKIAKYLASRKNFDEFQDALYLACRYYGVVMYKQDQGQRPHG